MTTAAPVHQPARLQIVFTNLGGSTRAWWLGSVHGQSVLVPMTLEQAKDLIARGAADEYEYPIPESHYGRQMRYADVKDPGKCSCGGSASAAVAGIEKTDTLAVIRQRRARFVTGQAMVGEPLFAASEGGEDRVACCGEDCTEGAATPTTIAFEKYAVGEGGYDAAERTEHELPKRLIRRFGKREHSCLPWVRVTRDPERFRSCLRLAREIGPMENGAAVYKLLGEYMASQDQEVFVVILVDVQLQVRAISEIARGGRDRAPVSVPDTLRIAIIEGASGMIMVHNHPSGVVKPSDSDKMLTDAVKDGAKQVKIDLLDHIIIGADGYYSFASHNLL